MNPTDDARTHNHADDLLEDYVLGTLSAEDQAWMDWHLQTCPICQEELAPLMGAMQALPFSAPEPDVPMSIAVWDRIEQRISPPKTGIADSTFIPLADEKDAQSAPRAFSRPVQMLPVHWLTIAALMIVSLIGGVLLAQVLPQFDEDDTNGQEIAIQFTDPGITATGELRYLPDQNVFVLNVEGMPEPPEGHVYQVWLIQGGAPVSAGLMNVDQGEFASAGNRSEFDTFAITVEPGPLGNEAPTSDPILVAPLHGTETG